MIDITIKPHRVHQSLTPEIKIEGYYGKTNITGKVDRLGNFIVKPVTNWVGKIITKGNNPRFNEVLRKYSESEVKGKSYIMQEVSESKISSGVSNMSGSFSAEYGASKLQELIDKREEK